MAYVIDENCVACGTCAAVCPEDAIYEGDIFEIDPEACIGCGSCAESCPNDALFEYYSTIAQENKADSASALFCVCMWEGVI